MLSKFLEQIKEKVEPLKSKFLSKSKSDEYEDDEEEYEDEDEYEEDEKTSTREIDTEALKSSSTDDEEEYEEDDESEEDEEDEDEDEDEDDDKEDDKEKKKKKLIKIALIGALLYLGLDMALKEEPQVNTPVVKKKKARKPRKNKRAKNKKVQKEIAKESTAKVNAPIKNSKRENEVVKEVIEKKPVPVEEKEPVVVPATIKMVEDKPNAIEEPKEDIEPPKVEERVDLKTEQDVEDKAESLDKQLTDIVMKVKENEEKEDVNLEYTAAPNYERFGQGLVYNCKGKHWACVDKSSYFSCSDNYKWAKQNGKPAECSTSKVLATPADCRVLQKYNINMVVEVSDCN